MHSPAQGIAGRQGATGLKGGGSRPSGGLALLARGGLGSACGRAVPATSARPSQPHGPRPRPRAGRGLLANGSCLAEDLRPGPERPRGRPLRRGGGGHEAHPFAGAGWPPRRAAAVALAFPAPPSGPWRSSRRLRGAAALRGSRPPLRRRRAPRPERGSRVREADALASHPSLAKGSAHPLGAGRPGLLPTPAGRAAALFALGKAADRVDGVRLGVGYEAVGALTAGLWRQRAGGPLWGVPAAAWFSWSRRPRGRRGRFLRSVVAEQPVEEGLVHAGGVVSEDVGNEFVGTSLLGVAVA